MKKDNKWIGYCTNVHAGFDLQVTKANLEKYALSVKQKCSPDEEMGIGLWLSANAVDEMIRQNQVSEFAGWLESNQLVPFTFNGFPHGNFHQDVVKHLVYFPTWAEDSRREYSEQLATVIDQLLPAGMEGSISTLPPRVARRKSGRRISETNGKAVDPVSSISGRLRKVKKSIGLFLHRTGTWLRDANKPNLCRLFSKVSLWSVFSS